MTATLPPSSLPPTHGRPRDTARELAILDAAIALLTEVGYDRLTIDAVATRAHASKATIYRRWPGKTELVAAAMGVAVPHQAEVPDTGTLRGDLAVVVDRVRSAMTGEQGDLLFGLALAARADPDLGRSLRRQLLHDRSPMGQIAAQARRRAEPVSCGRPELVDTIAPAMAMFRLTSGGLLDDHWRDEVVDDVLLPILEPSRSH